MRAIYDSKFNEISVADSYKDISNFSIFVYD